MIMDMHINKEFLRQQREQRGWTQSHLAEIADLSLRTVQRIETSGISSKESAMALAAGLDIQLNDLLIQKSSPDAGKGQLRRWNFAGFLLVAMFGLGWWSVASADQIAINLSIKTPANSKSDMQILSENGQQSEVKFDGEFRLLFTATRQDKNLLIATEIYNFVEGEYQLLSTPSFLVADNQQTGIHVAMPDKGNLELTFTPDF
jgi:transcriptional regulator with XRE-family HTH domain